MHWVNDKFVFCEGLIAVIWCIVWLSCITESPLEDKYISQEELKYIVDSIGPTDDNKSKISLSHIIFYTRTLMRLI